MSKSELRIVAIKTDSFLSDRPMYYWTIKEVYFLDDTPIGYSEKDYSLKFDVDINTIHPELEHDSIKSHIVSKIEWSMVELDVVKEVVDRKIIIISGKNIREM